jgi:hypothetical protein
MKQEQLERRTATVFAVLAAVVCSAAFAPSAGASTKWLCLPGQAGNPCTPSLSTTLISPTGETIRTTTVTKEKRPKTDCFYVYPTVSDQKGVIANRHVDPEQRSIALFQAARYSQTCRVFAPMYRQLTLGGIAPGAKVSKAQIAAGYNDVKAAWRDYLAKYNKGRGVVIIGHSQGTFVLRRLIANEIDPKPAARKRIVSALLLGGNVTVKKGKDVGGDFKHLRACRSRNQLGCVVAFSTYNATPPADTRFGRPSNVLSPGAKSLKGLQVLCTNPAALGGGSAKLDGIFPSTPFAPNTTIGVATSLVGLPIPDVKTAWIESRGGYSGRCSTAGGANVLRITGAPGAPALNAVPDATWGLHLTDANIALGDLVNLVRRQGARYSAARR